MEDTMGDLSGRLLHPDVVKALDTPPKAFADEYTFSAQQQPYQHQVEAWRALLEARPARSVLVTSGTGSGKTECFLIPILHDLATELDTRPGGLTGVRALLVITDSVDIAQHHSSSQKPVNAPANYRRSACR
jgi:superfamily II DNA/RNA helicase